MNALNLIRPRDQVAEPGATGSDTLYRRPMPVISFDFY
jgi:hypothetical protein